jgi:integrase/recombinase XerC
VNAELLDFLRHIRPKVAVTTYRRKQWQIQAFFKYLTEKEKCLSNVNRADVEEYLSGLSCSRPYRQSMCMVVREFYGFMKVRHPYLWLQENPAAGIVFKPDKSKHLPNVPSQASVDEIFVRLSGVDDELGLRNRLMAELAYGSGLRRCELSRIDIEDIDLETNTAQVTGKGNKIRVVPLTGRTAEAIREYLRRRHTSTRLGNHTSRGPLLLTYRGRRMRPASIYYTMRDNVGIRPHLLRHACATHLLKNGCGIRVIQELLGHKRIDTTNIYTAVNKENLREVVDRSHPRAMMKKS